MGTQIVVMTILGKYLIWAYPYKGMATMMCKLSFKRM